MEENQLPPNENSLTAIASPETHCPEHRHDNALQLVLERLPHSFILGTSEANRRMIRQSLFAEWRLPFANAWGVVLEELSHRLLEIAIVLVGILFNIERLGRGAAPHKLFGSGVE